MPAFKCDLNFWLLDDGSVSVKQAGTEYWYAQSSPDKTDAEGYPLSKYVVAHAYYHRLYDDLQTLPEWAQEWMLGNVR